MAHFEDGPIICAACDGGIHPGQQMVMVPDYKGDPEDIIPFHHYYRTDCERETQLQNDRDRRSFERWNDA